MCIYATADEPKRTKSDIVCYKVLERFYPKEGSGDRMLGKRFKSIYYDFKFGLGYLYKAIGFRMKLGPYNPFRPDNDMPRTLYPTYGGFYSYKTLDAAKESFTNCKHWFGNTRFVIVRCVIPKGTMYYKSLKIKKQKDTIYCSEEIKVTAYMNRGVWIEYKKPEE